MNKGLKGVPNRRLKEERELRGWSQKYVAEHIGADHYYLSRWERGTSVPSPFYRQKLCILFGKTAKELGLPGEDADESHNTRDKEAVLLPPEVTTVHDPAIPFLSVAATGLIGREDILSHLKECLCSGKNVALTALNGIPGVGKTTLAVTLAHDDEVLAHYSNGVLWAGVGPRPHLLGLLSRWGSLLGITNADAANLTSVETWTRVLRGAIGMRQMLLVIDDVWEIEAALTLKVGGPHYAYVMTTRFPQIAQQFAMGGATLIEDLNERDSTR